MQGGPRGVGLAGEPRLPRGACLVEADCFGDGRSVVLSAAYLHCARMEYEREARTIYYTRKQGLLH